jgi:uncharacterized protein (DUF2062 family)
MMVAFWRPFAEAFALGGVMLGLYVPLGYYVDRFFWNRRRGAAAKR